MKVAFIALLFTVLVVVRTEGKDCDNSEECENGCCIAQGVFRKGICTSLAKDGEECNDPSAELEFWGKKKFIVHCPCESGLTCEPESVKDLGIFGKLKINERCSSQPRTPEPETVAPADE